MIESSLNYLLLICIITQFCIFLLLFRASTLTFQPLFHMFTYLCIYSRLKRLNVLKYMYFIKIYVKISLSLYILQLKCFFNIYHVFRIQMGYVVDDGGNKNMCSGFFGTISSISRYNFRVSYLIECILNLFQIMDLMQTNTCRAHCF